MIAGIIQSNFVPWRGYFDIIDDVDLFIYNDDLQYTKGDWRNRNKIKTSSGSRWVTVPVKYRDHTQLICETHIDYSTRWVEKMKNLIGENYRKSPFFQPFFDEFSVIIEKGYETISQLNINMNQWIMDKLNINTPIKLSSQYSPVGTKTDRVLDIVKKAGAHEYLSGPAGRGYIETDKFKKSRHLTFIQGIPVSPVSSAL